MMPGIGAAIGGFEQTSGGVPFSAVKLLLGFEGANNATTTTDESNSANTMTMNGGGSNAKISTAQFKFGSSSCFFDGSGDEVYCQQGGAGANDFDFGAGPFTVDLQARFARASPTYEAFCGQWGVGSPSWYFYLTGGNLRFRMMDTGGTSRDTQVAWAPSQNTWYQLRAERDASNVFRIYRDGAMVAKQTYTQTMQNHSGTGSRMGIGLIPDFAGLADLSSNIDELRVIKGYAICGDDAGFSPQAAAWPRS